MRSFFLFPYFVMFWLAVTLAACAPEAPPAGLPPASASQPGVPRTFTAQPSVLPTTPLSPRPPVAVNPARAETLPTLEAATLQASAMPASLQLATPRRLTRGELQDAVFQPDGTLWVASASGVYVHDAQTLANTGERPLETGWVTHLAFPPDGSFLVLAGPDGVQTRNLTIASYPQVGELRAMAFTADGSRLAVLDSVDGTVTFWDHAAGTSQQQTFPFDDASRSLALSPDGRRLALGGETGRVELFDLKSGSRLVVLNEGSGAPMTDLAFSPEGAFLAGAQLSADGLVQVWSVGERKRLVEQYRLGYYSLQPFVAFSPDGARLLAGNGDLAVMWERTTRQPVASLSGYSSGVMDLAISPRGDRLAYTTYHWPAFVLDLPSADPVRNATQASIAAVFSLPGQRAFGPTFSPDGATLAAGLYNYSGPDAQAPMERVRLWNIASGDPVEDYPDALAAAFHPDGQRIALAGSDGSLRVTGRIGQGDWCLPGCSCSMAGNPPAAPGTAAGPAIVEPLFDGWTKAGGCSVRLPHDLSPMKLAFSPAGDRLMAWGVANGWGAAAVWELGLPGSPWSWFPGGSWPSLGAADNGAAGGDGLPWIALGIDELNANHGLAARWLVVHDPLTNRDVLRVPVAGAAVAAFSPDGSLLAVGLSSLEHSNPNGQLPPDPQANGLQLWEVATWQQLAHTRAPYGVTHLAFTPDGAHLVTASETGEIMYWSVVRK